MGEHPLLKPHKHHGAIPLLQIMAVHGEKMMMRKILQMCGQVFHQQEHHLSGLEMLLILQICGVLDHLRKIPNGVEVVAVILMHGENLVLKDQLWIILLWNLDHQNQHHMCQLMQDHIRVDLRPVNIHHILVHMQDHMQGLMVDHIQVPMLDHMVPIQVNILDHIQDLIQAHMQDPIQVLMLVPM